MQPSHKFTPPPPRITGPSLDILDILLGVFLLVVILAAFSMMFVFLGKLFIDAIHTLIG